MLSDVPRPAWLASMTSDWDVIHPKQIFTERRERARDEDVHLTPSQTYGVLPQAEYMAVTGNRVVLNLTGQENMKHVEANDFIIHLRSFQGGIEYSTLPGKVSNAYTVLTPKTDIEPRFYRWVLKSSGYIQELNASTNQLRDGQSIKFADFAAIDLPLPPVEEQRRIADFLDDQVARIDEAIQLRTANIDRFKELRQWTVTTTVTGADSPEPRMASVPDGSGLAGAIATWGNQSRWTICKMRDLVRRTKDLGHADLPLLGVSLASGVRPRSTDDGRPAASLDLSGYKRVRPGDIVMNALGKPHGSIGRSSVEGITSPAYWVMETTSFADSRYLHYLLRSEHMVNEYQRLGKYLPPNQFDISWDEFRDIAMPIPPVDEQAQIADFLDDFEESLEEQVALETRGISLLEERKRALITAAVTGELDVTTARPIGMGKWVPNVGAGVDAPAVAQASSIGGIG